MRGEIKRQLDMLQADFIKVSGRWVSGSVFVFFGLLLMGMSFFVLANDNPSKLSLFEDSDQDGLSNAEEALYHTDPNNPDTDGDGYSDGVEVASGYDPTIPAPNDRVIKATPAVVPSVAADAAAGNGSAKNLTSEVSGQIASVIKSGNGDGSDVSLDQINQAVQQSLGGTMDTVTLPDVDVSAIKVKKGPKQSLSDKAKQEANRKDITEYLTVVSYIIANNSPQSFHTENEFVGLISSLSRQSISGLVAGNSQQLDALSGVGEKMLNQLKDVEVPEAMLDLHIKALKMATYSIQLNKELKINPDDPLGQIAEFSKWQGFLGVTSDYLTELEAKLAEYNISEVPINL